MPSVKQAAAPDYLGRVFRDPEVKHGLRIFHSDLNKLSLAGLVQDSYAARQKAKGLLAEAKAKVEAFIEGQG